MKHLLKVLKLTSANKWQARYLTVTKEGTWLNIDNSDSRTLSNNACFCPLGILWMKKRSGRGRCLGKLKKHGKGGMLFVNVLFIEIVPLGYEEHSDLVQKKLFRSKQSDGMKILKDESAIIKIYSKPNINGKGVKKTNRYESDDQVVTFICSMVEAKAITAGCNAIIDTLNRNKSQKQEIEHQALLLRNKKDKWMQKIGLSNSYDSNNTVGLTSSGSGASTRSNRWNTYVDHESCCDSSVSSSHNYVMNYQNVENCNGSVSSSNNYVISQRHRSRMRSLKNSEHRRMRYINDEDDDPIPSSVSYYHNLVMSTFDDRGE